MPGHDQFINVGHRVVRTGEHAGNVFGVPPTPPGTTTREEARAIAIESGGGFQTTGTIGRIPVEHREEYYRIAAPTRGYTPGWWRLRAGRLYPSSDPYYARPSGPDIFQQLVAVGLVAAATAIPIVGPVTGAIAGALAKQTLLKEPEVPHALPPPRHPGTDRPGGPGPASDPGPSPTFSWPPGGI